MVCGGGQDPLRGPNLGQLAMPVGISKVKGRMTSQAAQYK